MALELEFFGPQRSREDAVLADFSETSSTPSEGSLIE
jgi:hypothetical protein